MDSGSLGHDSASASGSITLQQFATLLDQRINPLRQEVADLSERVTNNLFDMHEEFEGSSKH